MSCKDGNNDFADQVKTKRTCVTKKISLSENSRSNPINPRQEGHNSNVSEPPNSPRPEEIRVEIHQDPIDEIMDDRIEVSINEQEFEPDYEDNQVESEYEEDEVEVSAFQDVLESSNKIERRAQESGNEDKLVIPSKQTVADSEISFTVTDQAPLMQIPGLSEMVTQIVEAQVEARVEAKVNE